MRKNKLILTAAAVGTALIIASTATGADNGTSFLHLYEYGKPFDICYNSGPYYEASTEAEDEPEAEPVEVYNAPVEESEAEEPEKTEAETVADAVQALCPGKQIVFVSPDEAFEVIETRANTDTVYIEIDKGVVLDEDGNGELQNAPNPEFNYISYAGVNADPGTEITTYCVYNPDNNAEDDIIARYDFPQS